MHQSVDKLRYQELCSLMQQSMDEMPGPKQRAKPHLLHGICRRRRRVCDRAIHPEGQLGLAHVAIARKAAATVATSITGIPCTAARQHSETR